MKNYRKVNDTQQTNLKINIAMAQIEIPELTNLQNGLSELNDKVDVISKKISGDSYLSKEQTLEYCGNISPSTLSRWEKNGLPHVKLERKVLYRKSDIDAYLESFKIVIKEADTTRKHTIYKPISKLRSYEK